MELLSIAHERGVEAEIAAALSCTLEARELQDIARSWERFTAVKQGQPEVVVALSSLSAFDELLKTQFAALAEGDAWIGNGDNVLLFVPSGGGKATWWRTGPCPLVERVVRTDYRPFRATLGSSDCKPTLRWLSK